MKRIRPHSRPIAAALAVAAVALATASPAPADWLVLKDGAKVETKGAWRVDGRRILFDLPNGTLSMIRADQVDLDKSAVATAEARAVSAGEKPAPPPKKEPVLVLTEKDIPPSPAAVAEAAATAEGEAKKEGGAAEPTASLEVISWEKTESGDGSAVEIFGTIRNNSPNMITSPTVLVSIYDSEGGLLATNNGIVNSPQIAAGKTANFRVTFSGLVDFASAKFDAQGRGFRQQPQGQGEQEEPTSEEPVPEQAIPPSA
jgi:hypothetical protein